MTENRATVGCKTLIAGIQTESIPFPQDLQDDYVNPESHAGALAEYRTDN